MKKPIIQSKDCCDFAYKNCFKAYCLGVELDIVTDLNYEEFERLLDGKYSYKDIEKFEVEGKF